MYPSDNLTMLPLSSTYTVPRKRKLTADAIDMNDRRFAIDDNDNTSFIPGAPDYADDGFIQPAALSISQDCEPSSLELSLLQLLTSVDDSYPSIGVSSKEHALATLPCTDMPFLSPFTPEDDCFFFDPPSSIIPDNDALRDTDWFLPDADLPDNTIQSPADTSTSFCSPPSSALPSPRTVGDSVEAPSRCYVTQAETETETDTPVTLERGMMRERTVMIMTSKVAQKSYGTEKRFLCPPPMTVLMGEPWWSLKTDDQSQMVPPTLRIRIAANNAKGPSVTGDLDWYDATAGVQTPIPTPTAASDTLVGKCIAKHLHINDVPEKLKKVQVTVDIQLGNGQTLGTFASKDIKVISKPSKKRQSSIKNMDLYVHNGSTVSLMNRIRSQTVSTKYLGVNKAAQKSTLEFVTQPTSWDPFVIWAVYHPDEPVAPSPHQQHHPTHAHLPPPPPYARPIPTGTVQPIRYNQHIVLQCITTGRVSPVMIIRRIDKGSKALGGSDAWNTKEENLGDPVSQMHRVAFQIAASTDGPSTYLSCTRDTVSPCALSGLRKPYSTTASASNSSRAGCSKTCSSWAEDVPDTVIWTIIGTDCAIYTFWVSDIPLSSASSSCITPVSSKSSPCVTPFPRLQAIDVQQETIILTGTHLTADTLVYIGDVLLTPIRSENNTRLFCMLPPEHELMKSLPPLVDQHTKKLPISFTRGGVLYRTGMFYICS